MPVSSLCLFVLRMGLRWGMIARPDCPVAWFIIADRKQAGDILPHNINATNSPSALFSPLTARANRALLAGCKSYFWQFAGHKRDIAPDKLLNVGVCVAGGNRLSDTAAH